MMTLSGTDSLVKALRFQSQRYHDQHPFRMKKMNGRRLSSRQIQGRVANRFYYQENISREDAALLAHCLSPDHGIVTEAVQAANQPARPREAVLIPRPHPGRP